MRSSLLLSVIFLSGCWASCIILNCPVTELTSTIPCNNCSACLSQGQRFCASKRNQSCGCASEVPQNCSRNAQPSSELVTYCYISEHVPLPPPTIHPEGSGALSVVVQRFFAKPPFDARNPNNLILIARFFTPGTALCRDLHSIQAQRRSDNECVLRVKLAMPGIDHKTDDHYYYDDGTDLEANFSMEIFEGAKEVEFWTEVTLQHTEELSSEKLFFYSLIRSIAVHHPLQGSQPISGNHTTNVY